ncbi:MAG: VWA domain-containing protein [Promethearchaeota archaeon]
MPDIQLELVDGGSIDGRGFMSEADMNKLGVDDFDVVLFLNEFEDSGACQVQASETCESGYFIVDSSVMDSANVSEGDVVTVRKVKAKGGIEQVQIGVQSMAEASTEDTVIWVAEHAGELANLLRKRPIYKNLEIDWRDAEPGHIKLRIMKTKPDLQPEDVAIIDPTGHEILFEIVPAVDMTFNAILLLDVSGSMQKEDLKVRDADGAIEGLKKGLQDSEQLHEFLLPIEEGAWTSRIRAASLSTLLYLSLKIGRGWGENVQIIAFADDVEQLTVVDPSGQETGVIKCTGEMKSANLSAMASYVIEKTSQASGLTAMSVALKRAAQAIADFPPNPKSGNQNPVMIVLLTDGQPNKGDDEAGIPVNPIPVVKRDIASMPGVVLYCIGIGEADDALMQKLAENGRGEYFKADSFADLWKNYDTLAQRFAIAAQTTPDTFQEFDEE